MTVLSPRIICCKVSESISLEALNASAGSKKPKRGTTRMALPEHMLEEIYRRKANGRQAWAYSYGCIVLYGFAETEEREFLASFASLCDSADPAIALRYYESVPLEEADATTSLSALSEVLARSVFLMWAADRVTQLLDSADMLLANMRRSRIKARSRRLRALISESLRFEGRFTGYFGVLGRDIGLNERESFIRLSARYELHERLEVASMKLRTLDGIIKSYTETVLSRDENRLLKLEIALLLAFPLVSLFHMLPKISIAQITDWLENLLR